MLILGILLGLVLGLLLGGRLERLATIHLQFLPVLFVGVLVRFGTELALHAGIPFADAYRLPLLATAYALLLFVLWKNRWYPGLALAFVGIGANALAIVVNGGWMPVWEPAFAASGLTPPLDSVLHRLLPAEIGPEFLLRLGPLGDIIPIPIPPLQNVASLGDIFLSAGLGFFLFATLLRPTEDAQVAMDGVASGRLDGLAGTLRLRRAPEVDEGEGAVQAGTGLTSAFDDSMALERPMLLGGRGLGLASPALAPMPQAEPDPMVATLAERGRRAAAVVRERTIAPSELIQIEEPARPAVLERLRNHPYVRLSLNPSFSALWMGQIISLFGDRVNQIALATFVFEITDSALLTALTFFMGTVPNLFLSPIAGTFVDRWDQKQVLVVSDILRAAAVMLVPVAIFLNIWLVYPLIFGLTTISIFFRPARQAILPRIVDEQDLLPANSAMWVAETIADVVNYPIAGLFVVFLSGSLALAFWFDAVTYLASAGLLATIVVPPLVRRASRPDAGGVDKATADKETADGDEGAGAPSSVAADLKAGWAFLRHETVLLANTVQGAAGQFSLGVLLVATVVLAREITTAPEPAYRATYAFMETAIGFGSLLGGFVLGAIAGRAAKGKLIIGAYIAFGLGAVMLGIVDSVAPVLFILFGMGVANMAFVIPSQTLFQERTPPELMGRVVSLRFALVFGGMSLAMAAGGLLVELFTAGPVIMAAGVISVAAGVGGLFLRQVREA